MESPTVDPSDTSSSVAPSISSNGSPIQPTQMIVAQMKWLSLILLTFSNPPTPTSFPVILRKNKSVIDQLKPRFYISLNLLKPEISKFLEGKEFENAAGLGTSALYELVAQFIVELNREGTAAVTFVIPN